MPYQNFHSARVKDPSEFSEIKMLHETDTGIQIYGGKLKSNPEGGTTAQTYRFPKEKYTEEQAKKWLDDQNINYMKSEFEPAKKDSINIITSYRFDKIVMPKVEKTPEGYLRGSAPIAKVGVMTYVNKDGSITREMVPESVLFDSDSMKSLEMKPLTNDHPPEKILNSKTVKGRKIGSTGENICRIDNYLMSSMVITDSDAINAINSGRKELSPGYQCQSIPEHGEYNGEKYDSIQVKRIYNHVAICDNARGGKDICLKLDSMEDYKYMEDNKKMEKFKIDGIEYDTSQEVVNYIGKLQATTNVLQAKIDSSQADITKLNEQIVKIKSELPIMVKARTELYSVAQKIDSKLENIKLDAMSDIEIKKCIIMAKYPKTNLDGKDDAYINARYDIIIESMEFDHEAIGSQRKQATMKQDGSGNQINIVEKSKMDAEEKIKNAWKNKEGDK